MTVFKVDVSAIKQKYMNEMNFCEKAGLDYQAYTAVKRKNRGHFRTHTKASKVASELIERGYGKWIEVEDKKEKEIA